MSGLYVNARRLIVDAIAGIYGSFAGVSGAGIVGYLSARAGATPSTVNAKLNESVSVRDFGAIGTPVTANVTADTAAFLAALATGKNVYVPQGRYYVNSPMVIAAFQAMFGDSAAQTYVEYSGTGYAVQMGQIGISGNQHCELRNMHIICTNKATPVTAGVAVLNCFYFTLEGLEISGAFSPNTPETLQGWGVYLTSNSIIGRITQVSVRQWAYGYFLRTLATGQSYWTAAIQIDGQAEIASNMIGIVIGDPTTNLFTGAGVSIRDVAIQGNYAGGIKVNTGQSTIIESVYFEGNANFNISLGTTLGAPAPYDCRIINNLMTTDGLPDAENPYTYAPYTAHIDVTKSFGLLIGGNALAYSDSTPLIKIAAGVMETTVQKNRLSNASIPGARCTNAGTRTTFRDNYPEVPDSGTVKVGTFTRFLGAADGVIAYTGIGFKPSSIQIICAVDTVAEHSAGFSDGMTTRSISRNAAGEQVSTAHLVQLIRPTAADKAIGDFVSFDADGFSLIWSHTGTPPGNDLVCNYIAWK